MRYENVCAQCGEAEIDWASNTLWCADCLAQHQKEAQIEARIAELEALEVEADGSYADYLHHAVRGLRMMQIPNYGHD